MGSVSRSKPKHLAQKLLSIRTNLELSQAELAEKLSCDKTYLRKSDISRYESGIREPSLIVLLRYSRLAGVAMEILVDDKMEFPEK
jgi:transcriptional regulator with XRE-family HTH domain